MEQNNNANSTAGQQQGGFKCPRDCRKCLQSQRIYCASQHALSNMLVLDKAMEMLMGLQAQQEALNEAVKTISTRMADSEAAVFDPTEECIADPTLFPREVGTAEDMAE